MLASIRMSDGLIKLRRAALIALYGGAIVSEGLMLYAGRRNTHLLITILFIGWVLGPYLALVLADCFSKTWTIPARAAVYWLMIVVTLGSLAIYINDVLDPPKAKGAFVYVAVPIASGILIVIVVAAAALCHNRWIRWRSP